MSDATAPNGTTRISATSRAAKTKRSPA